MRHVVKTTIPALLIVAGTTHPPAEMSGQRALRLDLAGARYVISTVPGSGDVVIDSSEAEGPFDVKKKVVVRKSGLTVEKIHCQGTRRRLHSRSEDVDDSKGYWETIRVMIPRDRAVDLDLVVHRGESEIDLGGMSLTGLRIELLSGDHALRVTEPIRGTLDRVSARASRGDFHMSGLANIRAREFLFSGSAGDFDLDFDGDWREDVDPIIRLHASMGDLTVGIPDDVRLLQDSSSRAFMGDSAKGAVKKAKRSGGEDGPALLLKMRMTMGDTSLRRF